MEESSNATPSSLSEASSASATPASTPTYVATAVVRRRATTCEILYLTEQQYLNWCLLIGNDYTVVRPRNKLALKDSSTTETLTDAQTFSQVAHGHSSNVISQLKLLVQNYDDCYLTSDDEELLSAVLFSFDLYELRDLSGYDKAVSSEDGDIIDDQAVMTLSKSQKNDLRQLFGSGMSVIDVVEHCRDSDSDGFSSVTNEHIQAYRTMIEELKLSNRVEQYKFDGIPQWVDVCTGHYYQLVVSEYIRFIRSKSSTNKILMVHV